MCVGAHGVVQTQPTRPPCGVFFVLGMMCVVLTLLNQKILTCVYRPTWCDASTAHPVLPCGFFMF